MRELKDILKDLSVKRILGDGDKTITEITAD